MVALDASASSADTHFDSVMPEAALSDLFGMMKFDGGKDYIVPSGAREKIVGYYSKLVQAEADLGRKRKKVEEMLNEFLDKHDVSETGRVALGLTHVIADATARAANPGAKLSDPLTGLWATLLGPALVPTASLLVSTALATSPSVPPSCKSKEKCAILVLPEEGESEPCAADSEERASSISCVATCSGSWVWSDVTASPSSSIADTSDTASISNLVVLPAPAITDSSTATLAAVINPVSHSPLSDMLLGDLDSSIPEEHRQVQVPLSLVNGPILFDPDDLNVTTWYSLSIAKNFVGVSADWDIAGPCVIGCKAAIYRKHATRNAAISAFVKALRNGVVRIVP